MNGTLSVLDRIATRYAAKQKVAGLTVAIEQPTTGLRWHHGAGEQPYFVASITKLFTTAMIMQLRREGLLSLDMPAAEMLGEETMRGLVVHGDVDFGSAITVRELLSHTSGVPDYFEQRRAGGETLLGHMLREDERWGFQDFLAMARALPSPFPPSTPGKAHYSDTNYQLLGRIVELAVSSTFEQAMAERILEPVGLDSTWLFTQRTLHRYDEVSPILHDRTRLQVPRSIASFAPDGAVVSTTQDQVRFLRAWVQGDLFPRAYLAEMTNDWRSVFSRLAPIDSGVGVLRFKLPRWQTPLRPLPAMIGHSGAFGTFLFHVPQHHLYIAGTVNQMTPRHLPYPLLARLVSQFG